MTLAQLTAYISIAPVKIELLQTTHAGCVLTVNGHGVVLSPTKLAKLDKTGFDKLIAEKYSIPPKKN